MSPFRFSSLGRLSVTLSLGLGATLLVLWLLGGGLVIPARAADVGVVDTFWDDFTDNGNCTLREAIQAANRNQSVDQCTAGSGADTITLTAGVYSLSILPSGGNNNDTGDLDITEALTITGEGPRQTFINANSIDRVLEIRPGAGTVVISGVTLINGSVSGPGGGIWHRGTDNLTLINTIIASSTAANGGGLYVQQGSATLSGTYILTNTSTDTGGGGGGVYNNGTLQVLDSVIGANQAEYDGGGLYNLGTASAASSTFTLNEAPNQDGGGIANDGIMTVSYSLLNDNSAEWGGGVRNFGTLLIEKCTLSGNTAEQGGGISNWDGTTVITHSTLFINNTALNYGGGIYNANVAVLAFYNSSVISNQAPSGDGGGIYNDNVLALSNSSIADNAAGGWGGGICNDYALTISRTTVASNTSDNYAGGISNNGVMTAITVTVSANHAGSAGGIYNHDVLTMAHSFVLSNTSDWYYGGLLNDGGQAAIESSAIAYNTSDGEGGGISNMYGRLVVTDSVLLSNKSLEEGGGVFVYGGDVSLDQTHVLSNTAVVGSGLYISGALTTVLGDTDVAYNDGEGLWISGGDAQLTGSRFISNSVGIYISGTSDSSLLAQTCLISANQSVGVVYAAPTGQSQVTLGGTSGTAVIFRDNGPGGTRNMSVTAPSTQPALQALYNDWGVSGLATIEARLHHHFDDSSLAQVDYYTHSLEAAPAQQWADGVSLATLTATLEGLLNPAAGDVISFSTSLGTLGANTAATNYNQQASATLASQVAGTALVSAYAGVDVFGSQPATTTVDFVLADVALLKSAAPNTVYPGQTITYTLSFSNTGSATASGVVITDIIPPSLGNTSVISACDVILVPRDGITYAWDVADLALGQGGVITITAQLVGGGVVGMLANTASITTTSPEANAANNTDSGDVAIGNVAPMADAGPDQSVRTGVRVTLDGSASYDANGDVLTYGWAQSGGLAVVLSSVTVSQPTFTAPGDPDVLTFTLLVTDAWGTPAPTPDEVVITVTNRQPVAVAGPDQDVNEGDLVTLDGSASYDPDDDLPLSYGWTQPGVPVVVLSSNVISQPTFTALAGPAVLTFTLLVTDAWGLPSRVADEIVITVTAVQPPAVPLLDGPANGTLTDTVLVTLTWEASVRATGYWLDLNGIISDVGNVTHYAAGPLAAGAYTWTVAAYNTRHTSAYTDAWALMVVGDPVSITLTGPFTAGQVHSFGSDVCGSIIFTDAGSVSVITITRRYGYPSVEGGGLPRRYDIEADGSQFTATLVLCYEDAELAVAGIAPNQESNLHAYRYAGGDTWQRYSWVDKDRNTITTTQVTEFGIWGIGVPANHPTAAGLLGVRLLPWGAVRWAALLTGLGLCWAGAWWVSRRRRLADGQQ